MLHLELTYPEAQLLQEAFRESIDYLWTELHASKNTITKIRLKKKLLLLKTLNAILIEQATSHSPRIYSGHR